MTMQIIPSKAVASISKAATDDPEPAPAIEALHRGSCGA